MSIWFLQFFDCIVAYHCFVRTLIFVIGVRASVRKQQFYFFRVLLDINNDNLIQFSW